MDQTDLEKLKNLVGKVRGVTLQTDANYVIKKIGLDVLEKLQQKTKEMGWEVDYKNIKTMNWYPIGLRTVSLLAAQEAFGWGDEQIKDMGNCAPKYSFLANTILKYFVSLQKVFEETARYWKKHYTIGKLEPMEIDEKKKYAILRLRDFDVHPIFCPYLAGYFLRIAQFVIKSEKITSEESKCSFKGDEYHEFLVKWV